MSNLKRRWSFRTRLTALIALVFVTGGAALLGVQYLLVEQLFRSALGTIVSCLPVDGSSTPSETTDGVSVQATSSPDAPCEVDGEGFDAPGVTTINGEGDGFDVTFEQSAFLSREVLSGLLVWSVVVLLVFTVVAVFAASWLSRRPFARIRQITGTTQRITRDDLHQRLDLPGPDDEIKELGDTIDTMLDRLEASFTAQERFITNASHELRTPLTTTRAALEIPLEQGNVPEELQPAIRRALDANRRSEQLIAALLRLARIAPSDAEPCAPHDLARLLDRTVEQHSGEAAEHGIAVELSTSAALIAGADEQLLELALDNLMSNAIRHNLRGGSIRIASGVSGGRPWLEFANSGAPISPAEAERLTEPFNRGAQTRTISDQRGLGLGLTLVQNITAVLGAELTLAPRDGGGLLARIDFPAEVQPIG